ncbi:MAG TPA: alpha/beta hydrolase [Clostridiaceae bacterium]
MIKEVRRKELYGLLGDLPKGNKDVTSELIDIEEKDSFIIEKLLLDLNGLEKVPAYFIKPKGRVGKLPVILFNHSHGGFYDVGKDELLNSAPYMYKKSYAKELTELGYSILCIDEWGFGERRGRTEEEIFKEMLWRGQVMWGMMVYDGLRAIDYLYKRPDVDIQRMATLGMSMGSTMAWWLSSLDTRIKVCVDICCLTDYESLIEAQGIDGHSIAYFVPRLLKHFTTAQINSLISPRPRLSLNGIYDRLTPEKGLDIVNEELKKAYKADNGEECFKLLKYPVAHLETFEMRKEVIKFLSKWL